MFILQSSVAHSGQNAIPTPAGPAGSAGPSGSADAAATALDTGYTMTPDQLGPEALIMYLESRLNSLDSQIDEIFKKQKKIEAIRQAMGEITNALAKLNDDTSKGGLKGEKTTGTERAAFEDEILAALDKIRAIDPGLADKMLTDMTQEGQILDCVDGLYYSREVEASREYINSMVKSLESSAQMEMIRLQSMSSARGTAIQMSTNLIASFNEGPKAIVGNIR